MNETPESQLAVRYQRLVLLNRMSIALFGDKPLTTALPEACHAAMALMGAQSVCVYFVDEFGRRSAAHRQIDKRFNEEASKTVERELMGRAFAEKSIVTASAAGHSWEAAPLLRLTPQEAVVTGGILFGHVKALPLDSEAQGALVEIARHLRNARLIHQTLQHQKTSAIIVDQSSDAIFVTDLDQIVRTWNRGASKLFQWRAEEVLGRHGAFLVPPERTEEVSALIAEVIAKGQKASVETTRLRKDGNEIPVEGSFTLLKNDKDEPFAIVRAYRDITKRKEVERMKTEFVALVSHELRTPLTAIRGFAETIFDFWDELENDTRRHYLQIILNESKRLSSMVSDFLDITRIEAGGLETTIAKISIKPLYERIEQLFKTHPAKPRFDLIIKPDAETLNGDAEQLYRLFVNLAGNALKYTPQGGTVTLAAERRGDSVELSVRDQGPGISKADQARLFQKFFRANDEISRKTPGTGLGLAICKGIANAHGGDIRVESEPGQGARFIARLPQGPPPN